MLDALNNLKVLANKRGFSQTEAMLNQFVQYADAMAIDADRTNPFWIYVTGLINELDAQLHDSKMTDHLISKELNEIIKVLPITYQLNKQLFQHQLNSIQDAQKKKIFEEFNKEMQTIFASIVEDKKRLSAKQLMELNEKLAKALRVVFDEKNLPTHPCASSSPTSSSAVPKANPTDTRSRGVQFLDAAITALSEGLSNGNMQGAMQSFAGVLVKFVVGIIGDFFKAFLGKDAAPKVDKLAAQVGQVAENMFAPPQVEKGVPRTMSPAFERHKMTREDLLSQQHRKKGKDMDQEKETELEPHRQVRTL